LNRIYFEFWNNERTGIYVDVITGEPLFTASVAKPATVDIPL
jgi:peptide methionine sulfoxide reductase MsrB